MKKLLLTALCAMTAMMASAKDFTDQLLVSVNETETTQETTVTVEELEDNYINFVLRNFTLVSGENEIYVGNIEVNNLYLYDKGDYKSFSYNANLQIKPGDKAGVEEEDWIGPALGNVPLVLTGKLSDDKVYVTIDIDMMDVLEQFIYVKFGSDFPPAVVGETTFFVDDLKAYGTSYDGESWGEEIILDPVSDYRVILEHLSNGDIDLLLPDMPVCFGGETALLGSLRFDDVQTINRGQYYDLTWTGINQFDPVMEGEGLLVGIPMNMTLEGKYDGSNISFTIYIDGEKTVFATYLFEYGMDIVPVMPDGPAKQYTDDIVVTVNDESTEPMKANVSVQPLDNGGINFVLKNFTMTLGENEMNVGDICIEDLPLYSSTNGYKYFNYNGSLYIVPGDKEGVEEEDWVGPMLGEIPLRMVGRLTDDKLYVTIDIDMVSLEQIIHVTFGSQIETGVQSITVPQGKEQIYDLQGRRVEKAVRGLYIINGKKVLK